MTALYMFRLTCSFGGGKLVSRPFTLAEVFVIRDLPILGGILLRRVLLGEGVVV
jgi:hypothetical protein